MRNNRKPVDLVVTFNRKQALNNNNKTTKKNKHMNTTTEYLKGVTDTLIENFEFHTGGLDDHNRLSINFEDFYGSAKKRIGCKVKIYFPTDVRRDIDGDEVVNDYYDQDIIVYNSDKLGSFIADFETELSVVSDLNIKMR